MIQHECCEMSGQLRQPTALEAIREQMTIVKGRAQLVSRYSTEGWALHEEVRRSLARIDAAATQIARLLAHVSLPPA